jgi:hypothetical protein
MQATLDAKVNAKSARKIRFDVEALLNFDGNSYILNTPDPF